MTPTEIERIASLERGQEAHAIEIRDLKGAVKAIDDAIGEMVKNMWPKSAVYALGVASTVIGMLISLLGVAVAWLTFFSH